MKKIIFIILFCVLGLSANIYAAEYKYALTFGVYTYHYIPGDYTEGIENRLIAFEYKNFVIADFVNSHGRETQFFGYSWYTRKFYAENSSHLWVRGSISAGGLIGYGKDHPIHLGALSPGIYPTGSIGYDRYSIVVGLMPGFVWSGIKIEF